MLLVAGAGAAAEAGLAVVNARVWTGDPRRPWAQAVATSGERFLAVGTDEEIRALSGPGTRVIDANGGMLTPGFIDSHIHLFVFDRVHPYPPLFLRFVQGRAAVAEKIAAYAAVLPPGAWILGEDWTESTWGGSLPSKEWLDRLAPEHPVWLTGREGNAGLANSAALRAAGIGGHPTGVILGGDMWRVDAALIARSGERDDRVLEQAMDKLLQAGVTSVQHNNGWTDFLVLRRLHQAGKLRIRVYASPPLPAWQRLSDYISAYGRGDAWMHWGAVKGYGVIQPDSFYRWIYDASKAGLQVMVHTGEEPGLHVLVDIYERVRRELNLADPRFRLEHGHDLPADLVPRLAKAGAIASWQPPLLAHYDLRTAAGFAPPPKNLYPFPLLFAAGVKIAFGTDSSPWISDVVSPVEYLQMALDRPSPDGRRMTLDEALRAATLDAAYAEFAETEKGSIEPGKLADFVLFDRDFSRGPAVSIRGAKVLTTVVGGRIAYPR